jgi:hypothetical protein
MGTKTTIVYAHSPCYMVKITEKGETIYPSIKVT